MFLPAIEHDFCLNPTVTRSLSPFITPNVLASPFFISKSTITTISLIPVFQERGPRRSLLWTGSRGFSAFCCSYFFQTDSQFRFFESHCLKMKTLNSPLIISLFRPPTNVFYSILMTIINTRRVMHFCLLSIEFLLAS